MSTYINTLQRESRKAGMPKYGYCPLFVCFSSFRIKKWSIFYSLNYFFRTFANDYEKSRNEKNRNMENPFKFGTIVEAEIEDPFFREWIVRGE